MSLQLNISRKCFFTGFFIFYILNLLIYINFVVFISRKWEKFYGNWTKIFEEYKKLFLVDMKEREINAKTLKWFYGFHLASLLSFTLTLTRGLTATCWDDYKVQTIDRLIFETAYSELFKIVPYHTVIGIYFMMIELCCQIVWCFNDMFIVCISIMLHRNFEVFNERISINISASFSILKIPFCFLFKDKTYTFFSAE